ncbi:hypothetical protein P4E94_17100 [Pontiellaceae bacterium B12219]|nr:hypothetical protein [Pontiellaceae bacterium B12219]
MKYTIKVCIQLGVLCGLVHSASAIIKNVPDEDAVEEYLEELGEQHWHEDLDVDKFGSLQVKDPASGKDTYFHLFRAYLDKKYRVIVYDNNEQYIGFYETPLEPVAVEEGAVLVSSGDGTSYYKLPVTTEEFPRRMRLGLTFANFIKNQQLAKESATETKPASSLNKNGAETEERAGPTYREWTVSVNNQEITFNAVFLKHEGSRIYLKESKRGLENDFPIHIFSEKDKAYLKNLLLNQ